MNSSNKENQLTFNNISNLNLQAKNRSKDNCDFHYDKKAAFQSPNDYTKYCLSCGIHNLSKGFKLIPIKDEVNYQTDLM
jgi:hypothetical protein